MRRLVPGLPLATVLAMLTAWTALWSWSGLVERPGRFLLPTLVCGVLVVAVGAGGRALRVPVYAVPVLQLAACLVFVNQHFASHHSWMPTPGSVGEIVRTAHAGALAINHYTSPVSHQFPEAYLFLLACGVGIIVATDLLACGLRTVPLAGMPILLTLSIPISILRDPLSWWVFLATGALFLALLATDEIHRIFGWGRTVAARNRTSPLADRSAVQWSAGRLGMVTLVGAVIVPVLIPVTQGITASGGGSGPGNGHEDIVIVNPLINLRRDLVAKTHTPMVRVTTSEPDPSYLRLTVLDDFTGEQWRPSQRHLPPSNKVAGLMPTAPGLAPSVPGTRQDWQLRLDDNFQTTWLPTPYPSWAVYADGDWRYDARTLDIVKAGRSAVSEGLSYQATAFDPQLDAQLLEAASSPPNAVAGPMTQLPRELPTVIRDVARRVTKGARTPYEQAVKLQDWFRSGGGFTYSTAPAPGSGMELLAQFVTTDKVGYCEQFAAAMAVMGRALHIPSRVVVGFLHATRERPDHYLFTSDDLHAWPEMYFSGVGWVRFEPTPGARTGSAPAYTQQEAVAEDPSSQPSSSLPNTRDKQALPAPIRHAGDPAAANGSVTWWPLGLAVLVLLAGALAPRLVRSRRRRARLAGHQDTRSFAEGAWAELRATATDLGIGWAEHRSPRETVRRLRGRVTADTDLVAALEELLEFVERVRYGLPFECDPATRDRVRATVAHWSQAMRAAASTRATRWARWMPRSVFERRLPAPPVMDPELAVRI